MYQSVNNESSIGFNSGHVSPKKRGVSPWVKFGIPVLVVVIAGAVVGGIFGSRASKKSSANGEPSAEEAASAKLEVGRFATATNSEFMVPVYPSTTNSAAFGSPTFANNAALAWPEDSFKPANPSPTEVRPDRPRLIAPAYKWASLPSRIAADPYLKGWNDTIFANASDYANKPPVVYFMDGPSGILDNAREVKMRVKAFSYAYRMSNNTRWVDLAWRELTNAAGNGTQPFGNATDRWNSAHFLDVAELSAAYGIAYDWLYDQWTDEQKSQIRSTLIQYGLQPGIDAYNNPQVFTGWWKTNTTGNWNCVCNGGLTLASLAILGDDTSGLAQQLLGLTVDNAKENCINSVSTDGTWKETPNYWYFGTTGHAEMSSALLSATGSDFGLLDTNADFKKTGDFHMHVSGPTSLFDFGDHGPNKFSATANTMFLLGSHFKEPRYTLFQREQRDAAEPWSMFWYDASVTGAFWDGTPLDQFFDDNLDQWAAMRSSWTDLNALYVGIKAGMRQGLQTHNDLDAGDFVLDAMGTRWAGEYGNGDYTSPDYFSSDGQDSVRWQYYRKMTEGQNTLLIGSKNQNVGGVPTVKHESSNTEQTGGTTVFTVPDDSNVYWVTDMTVAYDATSVKRGVRLLNKRRQVLLQDEINASADIQWRMQTNATISANGQTATLTRDGKTMEVSLPNAPSGAQFSSSGATRLPSDVNPPVPDQENPGISVLTISLPAGQHTLQVLFNPQWEGMSGSDFVTPKNVALDSWSLTSHN